MVDGEWPVVWKGPSKIVYKDLSKVTQPMWPVPGHTCQLCFHSGFGCAFDGIEIISAVCQSA